MKVIPVIHQASNVSSFSCQNHSSQNHSSQNYFAFKSDKRLVPSFVLLLSFIFFQLLTPQLVYAKGVFSINLTSGSDNFADSYESVKDAFDQLDQKELQDVLPSYTNVSPVSANIDFRGLEMIISFAANSNDLVFSVPSLNISETFQGSSRDESNDEFVDYLKGENFGSIQKIQQALVRVSATDPIAGNPASLMGSMVSSDYAQPMSMNPNEFMSTPGGRELLDSVIGKQSDTRMLIDKGSPSSSSSQMGKTRSDQVMQQDDVSTGAYSGTDSTSHGASENGSGENGFGEEGASNTGAAKRNNNVFSSSGAPVGGGSSVGIDLSLSQLDLAGEKANTQTVVIEYQYQFEDPLKILRLKMPLGITDTEGSISYDVDLGIAYTFPLTRSWTLTPGLSYGVGGSEDLGGAAAINGYSLLSSYRFVYGNFLYNIGNMIGHYATGSVSLGDYEIDPGVSNTVFRNGVVVLKPSLLFDVPTMMQLILIDTRYSGDELYTEHYYEVGFAMGLITDDDLLAENSFNLGFTYLDSTDSDIKGYKLNFGYRF